MTVKALVKAWKYCEGIVKELNLELLLECKRRITLLNLLYFLLRYQRIVVYRSCKLLVSLLTLECLHIEVVVHTLLTVWCRYDQYFWLTSLDYREDDVVVRVFSRSQLYGKECSLIKHKDTTHGITTNRRW